MLQTGLAEQGVDDREARGGTERHRDSDGPVQGHHRCGQDPREGVIERGDARPVGLVRPRRTRMTGGDRRLDAVRAGRTR